MTKRKIVVRISNMKNEKCRTKAMKIAVAVAGVESVTLRGEERDQMVVIGERIDAVMLASSLRKSVGFTDVLSVVDLEPVFRDRYGALATDDNVRDAPQGRSSLAIVWRNDDSGGGADYNNNYGGRGGGGGGQMGNYHNYHNNNNNYPYDNYYLGN